MKSYLLSKIANFMLVTGLLTLVTHAMENLPLLEFPCHKTTVKFIHLPTGEKVREEINKNAALLLEDTNKPLYVGRIHCAFTQDFVLWTLCAINARDPELPVTFDYVCYMTGKSQDGWSKRKGVNASYKIGHPSVTLSATLPDAYLCPDLLKCSSRQNEFDGTFSFCAPKFQPQDIVFHCSQVMSLDKIAAQSIALEVTKNVYNCQAHYMGILETVTDKEYLANFREFYSENYYGVGPKIVELYFVLQAGLADALDPIVTNVYKYLDLYR